MSDYLPHEVFLEILLRLPTKSLLRFRCVSKSCNSIITNPDFITMHLHRPYKHHLFLVRHCTKRPKKEHYSLHFDNETFNRCLGLNFPFQSEGDYFRVVGSCNGLICLVDDYVYYTRKLILWNPSIRKSVTLPAPNLACKTGAWSAVILGFGFDSKTNDYKLVRISNLPKHHRKLKASINVELYSLATNSWKSITAVVPSCQMFLSKYNFKLYQALTNGNVHWFANYVRNNIPINNYQNFILSFDLSAEVFREIMIPESLVGKSPRGISLSILGESLCLFQREYISAGIHWCSHVWVMREYGVAESWTKLFSINLHGQISRVLGFRNNGDSLQQQYSGQLVLHNAETKELKYLGIHGVPNNFYLNSFVESLVLINQANDADSSKVVQKKRKSRGVPSQGNTSEVGPSKAPRYGMEIPDLPSQMVMAPTDGGVIGPFSIPRPDLGKGYPLPFQIQHAQREAWIQKVEQRIKQLLTVIPRHDPPSGVGTSWHPMPTENHVSSETRDELTRFSYRALKTSLLSSLGGSSMEFDEGFLAKENLIKSYSAEVLRGTEINQAKQSDASNK